MKLLFLPPQPKLNKRGKPYKRWRGDDPARVFLENGSEIHGVAGFCVESEPQHIDIRFVGKSPVVLNGPTRVRLEICPADVVLIDQAPEVVV